MSPTIIQNAGYVTQINQIEVHPENIQKLVASMQAQMPLVSSQPGFISSSLHQSLDGTRVLNYVQWETKEGLDAMHALPAFRELNAQYRSLAIKGGPALYEVISVVISP